jgi:hypothetical protein
VEFCVRVGVQVRGEVGFDGEIERVRFFRHPLGGEVGEQAAAGVRFFAASDIAMGAREPDLFEIRVRLRLPDRGFEIRAEFVDRQGVARDRDVRPDLGVLEFILLVEQTEE